MMGFKWGQRSSTKKKKKTLAEMVVSREAAADGLVVNGSKDESFFDSMESLVSDYEDDFYSVRGDLTPSHDGTPKNQASASAPGTPQSKVEPLINSSPTSKSEHSPRKKLSVFLQEAPPSDELVSEPIEHEKLEDEKGSRSIDNEDNRPPQPSDDTKEEISNNRNKVTPNECDATEIENFKDSNKEKNSNGLAKRGKVKNQKTMGCCLPRHSRTSKSNFSENDELLN